MAERRVARARGSVHFNARLPRDVSERLRHYADRRRISASAAAVELLDEALRMEGHPGIDFRGTPLGRQAFVTGTGLSVWELHHVWLDHGSKTKRVLKNYPHLNGAQINAAVTYAKAYVHEEPPGLWGTKPPFARAVRV